MSGILLDQLGSVMILRVIGDLTFEGIVESLKGFYPHVTCHVLWDLIDCNQIQISAGQYQELLSIAKELSLARPSGKTAFVGHKDLNDILMLFAAMAQASAMPYEYEAFKNYDAALEWLNEDIK